MAKDAVLDSLPKHLETTASQKILYFFSALFTSALPIYLYVRVKYLPVETTQSLAVLSLGTALATYVLFEAYKFLTIHRKEKLFANRQPITLAMVDGKRDKLEEAIRKQEDNLGVEALAHTLFSTNLLYLGFVLCCGFVIFRNYDPLVNYIASVGFPSVVIYFLTTTASERKSSPKSR
eukprot:TRINITY_DN18831_c0_g1::TRINITY_DN18831_c0_g1_i1::g.15187::m.15187 TRINITY_DN18831_c0_g1::TRINITY_DN18831_c0_g1_i1::g.15187  ORF type:complete len:189 (-),score=61.65,sp/Q08013/SSRG_RAT/28.49/8e-15,TRAP-gamma/PF07074.7/2.9e-19,Bac_Ubq_Cox/PF01654.12/0.09 TRINITY_DN18831_c0_g1_i1:130-663(-)